MRADSPAGTLDVRAIAGTRIVLMAWDLPESQRDGLRGFAIRHWQQGQSGSGEWLQGLKYFKSLVPAPVKGASYSSRQHPFQTFLWSEYTVDPDTLHRFTVVALYGEDLHQLEERHTATVEVRTEKEDDGKYGVWFNRGVIASHAYSQKFQNKQITDAMFEATDNQGHLLDPEVRWLSRGLTEACLQFIRSTEPGEALRVCAYEFTYKPVLDALTERLHAGVDVQIVFHDTKKAADANRQAIQRSGLPETRGGQQVLYPRTRTAIPHNKFIVKLVDGKPAAVWTGSVNFTSSGFFGQANVANLVHDKLLAATYLDYWDKLSADPVHAQAVENAVALTPNPPNAIAAAPKTAFFSPRIAQNALTWYEQRIRDARSLALITIPFNVAEEIREGLGHKSDSLRLAILEDPPSAEVLAAQKANLGRLLFSNGALLGKSFVKHKSSFGGATIRDIPGTDLDRWFLKEELARPTNSGHVFFVHSKFLLVDPLSDDPLVCSGSANFSKNSLIGNDENMIFLRGNTRVADIYMTEFDRIFRHFYARDAINSMAAKDNKDNPLELDATNAWSRPFYQEGNYKNNRRQLFFASAAQGDTWAHQAENDPDPFENEEELAQQERQLRNARRKVSAAAKRPPAKNPTARNPAPKKSPAKTTTARKRSASKTTAKAPARALPGAKKATATKAAAKKSPARQVTAKNATAKKSPAKTSTARRRTATTTNVKAPARTSPGAKKAAATNAAAKKTPPASARQGRAPVRKVAAR